MKAKEKRDLLFSLADTYVIEQSKNKVFGRENSESYSVAKGKLIGACMALGVNIEEDDNSVILNSQSGKYILRVIKNVREV